MCFLANELHSFDATCSVQMSLAKNNFMNHIAFETLINNVLLVLISFRDNS